MSKKFQIIVADPPYGFNDKLKMSSVKRGASSNYNTLTIEDIKNLPIQEISDPEGAILALWVPSSLLKDGMDIMETWGFNQKQTYIWVKSRKDIWSDVIPNLVNNLEMAVRDIGFHKKDLKEYFKFQLKNISVNSMLNFGMGHLFRQSHEICLIGINNNKIYKKLTNRSQRSVSFAENLKHSQKPELLQNSLELMFNSKDINKIELFARRSRDGWVCLGNEVGDKKDIRDSIKELK